MVANSIANSASQTSEPHWFHRQGGHGGRASGATWDRDHDGDQFTRSGSEGQDGSSDAGTFGVSQVQLFAAGTFFIEQPSSGTGSSTGGTAGTSAPAQPTASSDATSGATSTDGSSVFQGLNNALAALGFNQQEIQMFDQIAGLINNLSPTAFNDLSAQIEALAQQVGEGTAASGSSSGSNGASASNASSGSGAAPSGSTLQVEELRVEFSAVEVQGTFHGSGSGSQNSSQSTNGSSGSSSQNGSAAGSSFEFVAFRLQIQEITATFSSGSSQPGQEQTSGQSTGTTGTDQTTQAPQAAAA